MLYNKQRPQVFGEVIGQPTATALQNSVKMKKVPRSHLLVGERGVGKTTIARIYAKALNCLHHNNGSPCLECKACAKPDYFENDCGAFSDTKAVERLKQYLSSKPEYKYRVAILDEAHAITGKAQTAFLKFLEEPPEHAVILLLTTERDKIDKALQSRCLVWPLRLLSVRELVSIVSRLRIEENIDISKEAAILLAQESKGSARELLSSLEALLNHSERITPKLVRKILSVANVDHLVNALTTLTHDRMEQSFKAAKELYGSYDTNVILSQASKDIMRLAVTKLSNDEYFDGMLFAEMASVLYGEIKRNVVNQEAQLQIAIYTAIKGHPEVVTLPDEFFDSDEKKKEKSDKLWKAFIDSLEVGIHAGIYPKDTAVDATMLSDVMIVGKVITYTHDLNLEVPDKVKEIFADFVEDDHYQWRLVSNENKEESNSPVGGPKKRSKNSKRGGKRRVRSSRTEKYLSKGLR